MFNNRNLLIISVNIFVRLKIYNCHAGYIRLDSAKKFFIIIISQNQYRYLTSPSFTLYNNFEMTPKILLLVFSVLFIQVSSLNLKGHEAFTEQCFYYPAGPIQTTKAFTYTVNPAYTKAQETDIKNGVLNASQFVKVTGWVAYNGTKNTFFSIIGQSGPLILQKNLTFVQNVTGEPYSKSKYGLSTTDLQFAFGNPSQAKEYRVPSGKAIITVRFQARVNSSSPFVGTWSVLSEAVNAVDIKMKMQAKVNQVKSLVNSTKLTAREVTSVANIIPPFIESSLFWTFNGSPPAGTIKEVEYEGFVNVIRAGELVLAGPINNGQAGVIQIKESPATAGPTVRDSPQI